MIFENENDDYILTQKVKNKNVFRVRTSPFILFYFSLFYSILLHFVLIYFVLSFSISDLSLQLASCNGLHHAYLRIQV